MAQHEFEVHLELPDGRAMVDTAWGESAAEVRRAYARKWKGATIISMRLASGIGERGEGNRPSGNHRVTR